MTPPSKRECLAEGCSWPITARQPPAARTPATTALSAPEAVIGGQGQDPGPRYPRGDETGPRAIIRPVVLVHISRGAPTAAVVVETSPSKKRRDAESMLRTELPRTRRRLTGRRAGKCSRDTKDGRRGEKQGAYFQDRQRGRVGGRGGALLPGMPAW